MLQGKQLRKINLYLVAVTLLSVYFSTGNIVMGADSGLEYRDALLFAHGTLKSRPIVPVLIYSTVIRISDNAATLLNLLNGFYTILIVYLVYLISSKLLPREYAFWSAVFTSMPSLLFQYLYTYNIKVYPFLSVISLLFMYYFIMTLRETRLKWLLISSFLGSIAYETHMLAIPLLAFPAFLLIIDRVKETSKKVLQFYLLLILISSPYLIWRISNDGIYFFRYPMFWTTKYSIVTTTKYWKNPQPRTLDYYVTFIKGIMKVFTMQVFFLPIGFIPLNNSDRKILFSWLISSPIHFYLGRAPPLNPNYYYPLIPVFGLISGAGFYEVSLHLKTRYKNLITILILLFITYNWIEASIGKEHINSVRTSYYYDFIRFRNAMTESGNVLCYSCTAVPILNRIVIVIGEMEEDEIFTYLGWHNETSILQIMKKYNISYVMIDKDELREREFYNIGYKLCTGQYPIHYIEIGRSSYFKLIVEGEKFLLYKVCYPNKISP